ncbi:MAG: helix-turn-helix domain-containing protein [Prevotella sp.]|nr:helix-turn-helix domain-containing protein [Prevotella sp.]
MTDNSQLVNSVLIQGATLADIEAMIDRAVAKRMEKFYKSIQPKPDPLIKRVDAARLLGVSLPTLDNYGKYGILHPRHVGGRIYYVQSEIDTYLYNKTK